MPYPRNIRARRALTKSEARVLARFGDKLIDHIRTEKVFPIYILRFPPGSTEMDMGVGPTSPGKPFSAYFHYTNHNPRIPIRLKVTDKEICNTALKCRPRPALGKR
jgi:hypothetical protein